MVKKKIKKVIIVKRPKAPKFDLSFKKTEENTKIIVAIESLKANAGWQFLVQIFNENLKFIANRIISKVSETGKELTNEEVDILRFKYEYLNEIMNKPDKFLKELRRTDETEEDLDPYQK